MSNAEELRALDREYRERLHSDPIFSARVKLADNILAELEDVPRSTRPNGYAAYLIVAALDKALPQNIQAEAWEKGMIDAKLQALYLRTNVKNPYLKEQS